MRWGFKNFVCSGSSGIMSDSFFYTGATRNEKHNGPCTCCGRFTKKCEL